MRLNHMQEVRDMVTINEGVVDPKRKWSHEPASLISNFPCRENWYVSDARCEWKLERRESIPGIVCKPKQAMIAGTDILRHAATHLLDNLAIREVIDGEFICKDTFSESDLLISLKHDKRRDDMFVEDGRPLFETTAKLRHKIDGTSNKETENSGKAIGTLLDVGHQVREIQINRSGGCGIVIVDKQLINRPAGKPIQVNGLRLRPDKRHHEINVRTSQMISRQRALMERAQEG